MKIKLIKKKKNLDQFYLKNATPFYLFGYVNHLLHPSKHRRHHTIFARTLSRSPAVLRLALPTMSVFLT